MVQTQKLDYLYFAEEDYKFVANAYKAGIKGNPIGYLSEQSCEKYLKHLYCLMKDIDASELTNTDNLFPKNAAHNVTKLAYYLKDSGLYISRDVMNDIRVLNSDYFATRYPGISSYVMNEQDIRDNVLAMKSVREFTMSAIKIIENQKEAEAEKKRNSEEIDFGI